LSFRYNNFSLQNFEVNYELIKKERKKERKKEEEEEEEEKKRKHLPS